MTVWHAHATNVIAAPFYGGARGATARVQRIMSVEYFEPTSGILLFPQWVFRAVKRLPVSVDYSFHGEGEDRIGDGYVIRRHPIHHLGRMKLWNDFDGVFERAFDDVDVHCDRLVPPRDTSFPGKFVNRE